MSYFKSFGYETFKLFVTQFVMAIFGLSVMAALAGKSGFLLAASIAAVILYCFLIYSQMWEIGGKDRIRVDAGRSEKDFKKPLYMALLANAPNFILGLLEIIGYFANAASLQAAVHAAGLFLQSYLLGIINYTGLKGNPFVLTLTPFFAVFITFLSYALGYNGISFFRTSEKQEKKLRK